VPAAERRRSNSSLDPTESHTDEFDCEEDRTLRAVLAGTLREADR
jgi:hypothetical protein